MRSTSVGSVPVSDMAGEISSMFTGQLWLQAVEAVEAVVLGQKSRLNSSKDS